MFLYNKHNQLEKGSAYQVTENWNNFNFKNFWEQDEYAEDYIEKPLNIFRVKVVELLLGYKLPKSYIKFMKYQNGGIPVKTFFKTKEPTSWSEKGVSIESFFGIGWHEDNSLLGESGSKFWIKEWGYPDIGIAICDCPSGGHDMIFLDYKIYGTKKKPAVVHIDVEDNEKITFLADNFLDFINYLEEEPDEY